MHIRPATDHDREDILNVHLSAFEEDERETVAKLAVDLLNEETIPQILSLIAEIEGKVVGHIAFSPLTAVGDESFQGYILAPLGVKPAYQKRGVGSKLVESGMQQLREKAIEVIFVYGDPAYYSRFGFTPEAAERYTPPYTLQYPFGWLGIVRNKSATEVSPLKIKCVTSLSDPLLW